MRPGYVDGETVEVPYLAYIHCCHSSCYASYSQIQREKRDAASSLEQQRLAEEQAYREEYYNRKRESLNDATQYRKTMTVIENVCKIGVVVFFPLFIYLWYCHDANRSLSVSGTASQSASTDPTVQLAESVGVKVLSESDLKGKSKWQLVVMRNAPFARQGYNFGKGNTSDNLMQFFSRRNWFQPTDISEDNAYAQMSETEKRNIRLIAAYQKKHKSR